MLKSNAYHRLSPAARQLYEVIVGHTRVQVTGSSHEEAVQHARTRLCLEMPRMWDVIQGLDVQRFQVRSMGDPPSNSNS